MPSIIEGYSYDIFISYRQKDNKHDGWVTEFVDNLKGELEATFKEDISIYFDENPHDGLLETHSVDKSLEGKLKCLIFIPIISQTYCDSKSFAWQHELVVFNEMSKEDQFGRDIKLAGGNVASRILPIKIHDLDPEDKTLLENELGGVLRCVEFIYKSPGVNRPLRANEDHPQDNINKTYYRDQINKVANAVKEIITALKKHSQRVGEDSRDVVNVKSDKPKNLKTTIITGSFILLVLLILGVFFIPKLNKSPEQLEKSIAVLPFLDYSVNHDQEYFANGMVEEILNQLTKIKDLVVISRTSSMIYKDSKLPLKQIAKELGVSKIVEGSVQKAGDSVRIAVQLIEGATQKNLWSKTFDKGLSNLFSIQTEISMNIARELNIILTSQEVDLIQKIPTNSQLAYDYYLKGKQYREDRKIELAIELLNKATEQDPGFTLAYVEKASIYTNSYFNLRYHIDDSLAKVNLEIAQKIDPDLPEVKFEQAEQLYRIDRNHDKALERLDELKTQMINNTEFLNLRAALLRRKGKWEEAQIDWKKSSLLDPLTTKWYRQIGITYQWMRRYPEAMEYFDKPKLLGLNPENQDLKFISILSWKGDIKEALKNSELNLTDQRDIYFYYSRQYDKLISIAKKVESQNFFIPKTIKLAQAYFLNSRISLSKQYADSAIAELNLKIKEYPEDDRYYAALGYTYAYKGDTKKAIENAQKAVKLKPLKLDAMQGYYREMDFAKVYILTGEYDLAMDKIEYLLTIPGELSVPLLKIDPAYDRLRDLPRFQKILSTEYKTNY